MSNRKQQKRSQVITNEMLQVGSVFTYKGRHYEIESVFPGGAVKGHSKGQYVLETLYETYRRDDETGALINRGEPKFFVERDFQKVRFLSNEEVEALYNYDE